jgi:hypothetical protein
LGRSFGRHPLSAIIDLDRNCKIPHASRAPAVGNPPVPSPTKLRSACTLNLRLREPRVIQYQVVSRDDHKWSFINSRFKSISVNVPETYEVAMERSEPGALSRCQTAVEFGYLPYVLIAGILLVVFSNMVLTFANPHWNTWFRIAYGECERLARFTPFPFL